MLILPFSSELSYSQPARKEVTVQHNIHNPPVIKQVQKQDYITMQATAYDLSIQCCGKSYSDPSRGIATDGYNLNNKSHSEARTVSSNKFPMGTKLFLEFPDSHKKYNNYYIVHDTGNFKDNVLDIYLGDFGEEVGQETINFGRVDVKVMVIK
jgi:3D (Asp-Asp-Asp) domain-containing protein